LGLDIVDQHLPARRRHDHGFAIGHDVGIDFLGGCFVRRKLDHGLHRVFRSGIAVERIVAGAPAEPVVPALPE
jgi:hypothetical protein